MTQNWTSMKGKKILSILPNGEGNNMSFALESFQATIDSDIHPISHIKIQ